MSFLYQTRTLTSITRKRLNVVYPYIFRGRVVYRNFSGSLRSQRLVDRTTIPSTTSPPSSTTTKDRLSIKRNTNASGLEPLSDGSWEFDPEKITFRNSTEGPRGFRIRKHGVKSFELGNEEVLGGNVFAIPETIEFDEDFDDNFSDKNEIQELTETHQNRGSTITIAERHAFQKIFSDIFENHERPSSKKEDLLRDDGMEMDTGPGNQQNAKSKLNNILTSAMRMEPDTREGMKRAVERYPIALRAAAARAMGLVDDEINYEEASLEEGKALDPERLEEMRGPERARVEGLMKNAQSDFELWDIMEKEVFILISKLGLEDRPKVEDAVVSKGLKNKKKRGKKSATEAASEEKDVLKTEHSPIIETGNGVSPLSLYGPLYPSYLLLGLRLFDRGFAKPSPLALSLLPRIKSLGFISHVLGATTPFYNELLRVYRYRQDDFRGMLNLLTEMEHAALDVEEETLTIVLDVMRTQLSVHRGEKGAAIQALWSMPEFAPNKFRAMRDAIRNTIEERKDAENRYRY